MAGKIDRKKVRAVYERAIEICGEGQKSRAAAGATADNIWRCRSELEGNLRTAGLAWVLEVGDDAVRTHLDAAAVAALRIVRLPLEPIASETRPEPDIRKTIIHKPTGQQVQVEITRLPDTGAGHFTFENYERRIVPPPGARSGWHSGIVSTVVGVLAAFGSPDEAREAVAIPEAWYRSSEVLSEEAAFAYLRGMKSWILGNDSDARSACEEVLQTAQQEIFRPIARAVVALIDKDGAALRQQLADLSRVYAATLSRQKHYNRYWLPVLSLALCRMARTAGVVFDDNEDVPTRFLAAGMLR